MSKMQNLLFNPTLYIYFFYFMKMRIWNLHKSYNEKHSNKKIKFEISAKI